MFSGQNDASKRVVVPHKIHKDLIPKPKGLAGRSPPKGYNLQDAMGLMENRARYNKIAVRQHEIYCGDLILTC